jgi:hypothetical protein
MPRGQIKKYFSLPLHYSENKKLKWNLFLPFFRVHSSSHITLSSHTHTHTHTHKSAKATRAFILKCIIFCMFRWTFLASLSHSRWLLHLTDFCNVTIYFLSAYSLCIWHVSSCTQCFAFEKKLYYSIWSNNS